jgi:putative addiction module CopG family antidote
MNISLPRDLEELLRAQVQSGAYASYNEIIIEALHLFEEREQVRRQRRERLLMELARGINQADSRQLVDLEDVLSSLGRKPAVTDNV